MNTEKFTEAQRAYHHQQRAAVCPSKSIIPTIPAPLTAASPLGQAYPLNLGQYTQGFVAPAPAPFVFRAPTSPEELKARSPHNLQRQRKDEEDDEPMSMPSLHVTQSEDDRLRGVSVPSTGLTHSLDMSIGSGMSQDVEGGFAGLMSIPSEDVRNLFQSEDSKEQQQPNSNTNSNRNCNSDSSHYQTPKFGPATCPLAAAPLDDACNMAVAQVERPRRTMRRSNVSKKKSNAKAWRTNVTQKTTQRGELPDLVELNPNSEKRYRCKHPGCGREFRGKSEIICHVRTHTGERPHVCSEPGCGRRFAHSSNLRAHERSHRGEKPYKCVYPGCGKAFAHSVSLKEHHWAHEGRKPYQCQEPGCGKSFTQMSNFTRHKKLHQKKRMSAATAMAMEPMDHIAPPRMVREFSGAAPSG